MDALRAEIERKRKLRQEATGGQKWVRRGQIEERLAQKPSAALGMGISPSSTAAPAPAEAPESALAAAPGSDSGKRPAAVSQSIAELSDADVKKRLRGMNQPIALFGESAEGRRQRCSNLAESLREAFDANVDLKKGGLVNERQIYERRLQKEDALPTAMAQREKAVKSDADSLIDDLSEHLASGAEVEGGAVLRTMQDLLVEWRRQLGAQDVRSVEGRRTVLTFHETCRHLRPLVHHLKAGTVPADICTQIGKIFEHVEARRYVEATDAYILAAIGNAPWPIGAANPCVELPAHASHPPPLRIAPLAAGVTMVGIHVRAAREKIQSTMGAHVMNDETQRKYLTAIKRLITFAQKSYPTVPSQMVLHWNYSAQGVQQGAGAPAAD